MTDPQIESLVGPSWVDPLRETFNLPFMAKLGRILVKERKENAIYPSKEDMFRAFRETPYESVKVVIVGQDPYPQPGVADGLAFSARYVDTVMGQTPPASLLNILREANDDVGLQPVQSFDLTPWASQGALMLNTLLTVRAGQPLSHVKTGWRTFTRRTLDSLVDGRNHPFVFVGWGLKAQAVVEEHLDPFSHYYVRSSHPSPRSADRGFFGSKPFSKINDHLIRTGQEPIDWSL